MPLNKLTALIGILLHFYGTSQSRQESFNEISGENPDTLYYPFNEDGLQLVIIADYDHWFKQGSLFDAMYPRSGSWFMDHGPAPKNTYLWRNRAGEVIKQYHTKPGDSLRLRNTDYTNRSGFQSIGLEIMDYRELNYLKIYNDSNQVGLINLEGEIVLPVEFEDIRIFQTFSGISKDILVLKAGKFGLLDPDLNVLFPPIYSEVPDSHMPYGNCLKVAKNGKYGLIDRKGKVLIDLVFDEIRPVHDSLYIGMVYQDSSVIQKLDLRNYWNLGYKSKACIVFDNRFRIVTELKDYEYIYYWGTGQLIVKKDGGFGVMNTKGEIVIPLEYDAISGSDGYYHVGKDSKCGLFNTAGKLVLPIEFTRIWFHGKAVYVIQNELTGVYNDQFRLIAKPQFKYSRWNNGRIILTRPDGSEGFVNYTEKEGSYYQSPEGEIQKL